MSLLQVKDLTVSFTSPYGEFRAVDGISFDIAEGEVFGIVGESGSGKTLTALSVLKLVPYPGKIAAGQVCFRGEDILSMSDASLRNIRGSKISMVFQEPASSFDPVFTIGSQLVEAIRTHRPQVNARRARDIALEYLEKTHIKDPERVFYEYPHRLSGGMKQRIMIAMALVNSPDLIILDEPTTALDVTIQAQVLDLLCEIREADKLSMLFISHDFGVIKKMCARVAVMNKGKIVEAGPVSRIIDSPKEAYTISLIESVKALS